MKKTLALLLAGAIISTGIFYFITRPRAHFVYLDEKQFRLNGNDFFPLVLNYELILRTDKNELWVAPYPGYNDTGDVSLPSREKDLQQFKIDMKLVREMGFNTVRLVGIGEEMVNSTNDSIFVNAVLPSMKDFKIPLSDKTNDQKYLNALSEMLGIVNECGLKAILLTRLTPGVPATESHLLKLAGSFRNDSALMAYDLFNEPYYFDTLERDKKELFHFTKDFQKKFRKNAPDQLLTIGLVGIREVFKWDPNALNVDFISFHPYEIEPGQVNNEMFWYANFVDKPWIIGETGLPADNDSVPYAVQKQFAATTLSYASECGASGYSWWQFRDVNWHSFHQQYLGVTDRNKKVKPVADVFKNYKAAVPATGCHRLPNYYNYSGYTKYKITGTLTDQSGKPLEGGVVVGWDITWKKSVVTTTKADGTFELFSNEPICHTVVSSPLHTVIRGDVAPGQSALGVFKLWEVYF